MKMKLMLAAVVVGSAFASVASADVILSNLPGTSSGTGTNLGLGIDAVLRSKAVGFTMGSDAMDFVAVDLLISNTTPASTLSGGIYSDVAGNPGSLLASFMPVPVGTGVSAQIFTLTVAGTFVLNANTSYWIRFDGPATTQSVLWNSLNPNVAPTPSTGITFLGYRFSTNDGATWTNSTIFNGVTVHAVIPAPGALALLAVAGVVRRRRRRSV